MYQDTFLLNAFQIDFRTRYFKLAARDTKDKQ